ncbi:MAG: N-acetylmuramate alpha-1-phosphate uridylyltransferase MurU [Pontibacterium sp.]
MKVMILAAGLGTRMRPLTLKTPKPLLKIAGRSLIEHHIVRLREAGFRELVINHAWLGEQIEQHLGTGKQLGVSIQYSAESEPLETAGGIVKALPLLSPGGEDPFAVINGDIFCTYPYQQLPVCSEALAHLVLVPNPEHNKAGDFLLSKGRVLSQEQSLSDTPAYTFSGISVLSPALFEGLGPGEKAALAPLLRRAICDGKVTGELYEGYWVDVGTPQRLEDVDVFVKENLNNEF